MYTLLHMKPLLGEVITEQGRRTGWIATSLKVDRTTVHRWITGERPIPPGRVTELAELLGVTEDEITGAVPA